MYQRSRDGVKFSEEETTVFKELFGNKVLDVMKEARQGSEHDKFLD